jgi:molybdopterin synthase sulfur carrier subunit
VILRRTASTGRELLAPHSTLRNRGGTVKPANPSKHPPGSKAPNSPLPVPRRQLPPATGLLTAARGAKESPQEAALRYNSCVATVSQSVRVKVLFFGRLKDIVGESEESLELSYASTIEELFALYSRRIPQLAKYRSSVVASRNQEFAAWDTVLYAGDEVAFLPPVSGG